MSRGKTLEAIVSIAGQLDPSLQKTLGAATKKLSGMKIGMAAVGTSAVAATAAMVKFGADSVKSAADYQKQMANVSTLLDGTQAEVDKRVSELSNQMLDVSNKTGVVTDDLTDGLYQMISAVGDSKDVSKQVELAAKGAAAGNATTTDSINLLSAVTKAYGDTSYDAMSKVSDLAFNTVKLGQTTFPELASSIQQVTGSSKTLGVSQEELFGVMATATGVTGNTAAVATQLKAVYSNLLKPSSGMSEALQSLGYSSGQAAIQALGFQGTLDALSKSCNGDASAMANMFSSSEALNLVLGLTGDLSQSLTDKTKAMYNAAGMTDEAFGKQTNTLEYTIQSIKNLGKNFMTSVGMKILPVVQKVAQAVLPKIQSGLEQIGPILDTIYGACAPIISAFGNMIGGVLPSLSGGIGGIAGIFGQLGSVIQPIVTSIMPPLQELFSHIGSVLQSLAPVFGKFISTLFPQIGSVIQALSPIISTLVSALSPVVDMIGQLVSLFLPKLSSVISVIVTIIQGAASVISQALSNIVPFIAPVLQNIMGILTGICDFVTNVFTGNWSAAWESVKSIFSNCFNAIVGIAKAVINGVAGTINGIINGINSCGFTVPDWVPGIGGKAFKLNVPTIPTFAAGGFTDGPSIAGEAGQEAVISFDSAHRDENLSYWAKAGRMLGVNDGILSQLETGGTAGNSTSLNVTFAPNITINGTGDNRQDIVDALKKEEEDFMDMLEDMLNRRGGDKYGFNIG